MMKEILDNSRSKMQKAIDTFSEHLETIRTGRANAGMLAGVEADYYGCRRRSIRSAQSPW